MATSGPRPCHVVEEASCPTFAVADSSKALQVSATQPGSVSMHRIDTHIYICIYIYVHTYACTHIHGAHTYMYTYAPSQKLDASTWS